MRRAEASSKVVRQKMSLDLDMDGMLDIDMLCYELYHTGSG
jgi:hypothetical protein